MWKVESMLTKLSWSNSSKVFCGSNDDSFHNWSVLCDIFYNVESTMRIFHIVEFNNIDFPLWGKNGLKFSAKVVVK